MNQIRLMLVILAGSLFLVACGSSPVKMVKKPGFDKVKKVALVGAGADRTGFIGQSLKSSFNAMTALVSPDTKTEEATDDKLSRKITLRLLNKGLALYAKELAKVPGWKIVPFSKAKRTKAYARFRRAVAKRVAKFKKDWPRSAKLGKMGFIQAPGSAEVMSYHFPRPAKDWKALARGLKVDAVLFTWHFLSYEKGHVAGIGKARGATRVVFTLVDKNGVTVAETPIPKVMVGQPGFGDKSDDGMLEFGDVELDEKMEPLLWNAIEKSGVMFRDAMIIEFGGTPPKKKT